MTPHLSVLRVKGWQVYVWRDGDAVTLIDTGAPGSGAEILSAAPGVDRIVLTHGHVDHSGSAGQLHHATGRKPRRRFGGWPPSTSTRPASATASRSLRVPVTGFARWLPH